MNNKVRARVLSKITQEWPHAVRKTDCAPVSARAFEAAVHDLRQEGQPIASDAEGYWLATTPKELRDTAEGLRRRVVKIMETARALEETADRMEAPQGTLFPEAAA